MMQRRLRTRRIESAESDTQAKRPPGSSASVGNRALAGAVQAKLEVGPAGDRYEREADRVAHGVVSSIGSAPAQRESMDEEELQMSRVQRQGIDDEELLQGSWLRRQSIEDEELMMSRVSRSVAPSVVGAEGGGLDAATESAIASARSGGRPLGVPVRREMESAFGADFSGVRVHTGPQADSLNHSMQARAFTTGNDMFVRRSDYAPGSRSGKELIAHELTHVVQQGAARSLDEE